MRTASGSPHLTSSRKGMPAMAHETKAVYPATLVPEAGWHFLHLFYRVDRRVLAELSPEARREGREVLARALDGSTPGSPDRIQCFAVPGHKAEFGVMLAGSDLKAIHAVQ